MTTAVQKNGEGHPSLSDDMEKAVPVYLLNLDYYRHKEIYTRVTHILDLSNPLPHIDKAQCSILTEPFCE